MKLNYKRTVLIGLAFMSISAFWQLYNNAVPLYLKNTYGITDDISGYVMAADNVLAVFLLPLFGALSDRTRSRFGRRKPYILIGSFLAAALMILIPLAGNAGSFPAFIGILAVLLIVMSSYRSPAVALMPVTKISLPLAPSFPPIRSSSLALYFP